MVGRRMVVLAGGTSIAADSIVSVEAHVNRQPYFAADDSGPYLARVEVYVHRRNAPIRIPFGSLDAAQAAARDINDQMASGGAL